jgi:hypothetical protein
VQDTKTELNTVVETSTLRATTTATQTATTTVAVQQTELGDCISKCGQKYNPLKSTATAKATDVSVNSGSGGYVNSGSSYRKVRRL